MHMNTMLDLAIAQHEMYQSYIKAGFTQEQALDIIVAIITEGIANQ